NFIIVLIIPALIAWLLSNRWPKYGLAIFGSLYLVFVILFFTARYINPRFDFPQAVVNKQQEFINLKGGSSIPISQLKPDAISFLINTPQAITLSSIRPYPSDVKHLLSLAAAVEVIALLLMFALFLIWPKNGLRSKNLIYFCIFFSVSVLLAIGFSVNNLGAIVRYRSIILPLLVIPMAALIDWRRLGNLLTSNIRNKNNIIKNA
ncbi:MAG TPA: hypothetical protein VIV35_05275, partial [Chitinophagaceae bacterium]